MAGRAPAWRSAGAALALCLAALPTPADEPRTNAFNDPFGQATHGLAGCPVPLEPLLTAEEARKEAHWRAERGTSCFRSGRCRLPNAYRYDAEIFPRVLQYLRQDGRFEDTSLWITVQRRWVSVQGCVRTAEQGAQLEAALRLVDDVEAVVPQWQAGTEAVPPYEASGQRSP